MLNPSIAQQVIDCALSLGADFSELYVERNRTLSVGLKSRKVEQISDGIDFGIGLRVLFGTKVLYGYTNTLEPEELLRITRLLCSLDRKAPGLSAPKAFQMEVPALETFRTGAEDLEERIQLLQRIDELTRKESPLISQVSVSSSERHQEIELFNSFGLHARDLRRYTRIGSEAVATDGDQKDSAFYGPGASMGWEFARGLDPAFIASEIARQAVTSLKAEPCPAGTFPVVIDNAFGGVIFHEACGHLLETTSVEKKASVLWDKKGELIANPAVNAVDDGTIPGAWGSLTVDDEGMKTRRTQLIRNGVLENFMADYVGELKSGHPRTGSARRQSYRFAPASRMRNTFIEPGPHPFDSLIASIDRGLYAKSMGGGSVKTGTGEFNFSVREGYWIENGKIIRPVKGATLIGTGPETLKRISMVADNFELMAGMCGSVSGSIPAAVGQPAIKVDEILVGGAT